VELISIEIIALMIGIFLGVVVALHIIDKYTSMFDIPDSQVSSSSSSSSSFLDSSISESPK